MKDRIGAVAAASLLMAGPSVAPDTTRSDRFSDQALSLPPVFDRVADDGVPLPMQRELAHRTSVPRSELIIVDPVVHRTIDEVIVNALNSVLTFRATLHLAALAIISAIESADEPQDIRHLREAIQLIQKSPYPMKTKILKLLRPGLRPDADHSDLPARVSAWITPYRLRFELKRVHPETFGLLTRPNSDPAWLKAFVQHVLSRDMRAVSIALRTATPLEHQRLIDQLNAEAGQWKSAHRRRNGRLAASV